MPDPTSPSVLRSILAKHSFRPRKGLGQNFLVDANIVQKILSAADLSHRDVVVEIGPGVGALTKYLAKAVKKVIAVEIDRDLLPILAETITGLENVEVVLGDALKVNFDKMVREKTGLNFSAGGDAAAGDIRNVNSAHNTDQGGFGSCKGNRSMAGYKVLGNLPYYISTPLIMHLLTGSFHLHSLVMMVQKEIAERITAVPGGKDYGILSVAVQFYTVPELVHKVPRTVFIPPPKVDSAVVKMYVREKPAVSVRDDNIFFAVVRAAFGKRRKTLVNALADVCPALSKTARKKLLTDAGVDPERRGETLNLAEFAALADALYSRVNY